MRIIAGKHRGVKLKSVPGNNTRPTSDQVKEAVFNMIGPYFSGGSCLDLFAGSGSLGLEAISRGMDEATFIDRMGIAVKTIHENIKKIRVQDQTKVYRSDSFKALTTLVKEGKHFQLIFIDPPYQFKDIGKYLDIIVKTDLLAKDGMIIYEHDANNPLLSYKNLCKIRESAYGTTAITILKKDDSNSRRS